MVPRKFKVVISASGKCHILQVFICNRDRELLEEEVEAAAEVKWGKDSGSQNASSGARMRCRANHDKSYNAIQIWGFALVGLNRTEF